jgi:rsbT co-antagonist protein RsbR
MAQAEAMTHLPSLLQKFESEILKAWIVEQEKNLSQRVKPAEISNQSQEFLRLFSTAIQSGNTGELQNSNWDQVRQFLMTISKTRSHQGFSPTETAMFVFSLKQTIFTFLRRELSARPDVLAEEMWSMTVVLDRLGLYTTEIYQKTREEIILRQQEEMLELSTPVVKLWDGVLALPLIGTLDSSRTQVVMEALLHKIVETNSETAIIDITGVPTVDTLVAQHLIKTVTAARLMGAECIISGIRPQIAATIVHLGVDLSGIATKSTLADAFALALTRTGRTLANGKTQLLANSKSAQRRNPEASF